MPSLEPQSSVKNLSCTELREHLKTLGKDEYALIDVRQPDEFEAGHIDGALLMPLPEIEAHADELKRLTGRKLVFYCRSGGRSAKASTWASAVLGLPNVMNLLGGFIEWQSSNS